ncbi:hypothetical protein L209DRAFT_545867 [Thermothelomyces heterothallicus CBS 203.75]
MPHYDGYKLGTARSLLGYILAHRLFTLTFILLSVRARGFFFSDDTAIWRQWRLIASSLRRILRLPIPEPLRLGFPRCVSPSLHADLRWSSALWDNRRRVAGSKGRNSELSSRQLMYRIFC